MNKAEVLLCFYLRDPVYPRRQDRKARRSCKVVFDVSEGIDSCAARRVATHIVCLPKCCDHGSHDLVKSPVYRAHFRERCRDDGRRSIGYASLSAAPNLFYPPFARYG